MVTENPVIKESGKHYKPEKIQDAGCVDSSKASAETQGKGNTAGRSVGGSSSLPLRDAGGS